MTTFGSSLVFIFNPEYHSINLFFGIFLFLCVYEALKEKNSLSSFVLIGFILWLCNSFLYPSFISQMNDEFVKKWYELFTLLVPGLMLSTWIHYLKIYQEPPVILFLLGLKTALFFILYRNHTISHHDSFYLIFNDLIKSSISAIGFFYSFRISHLKELLIIQATMLCPFLDGLAKNATIIQPILSIVTIPWIACICFFLIIHTKVTIPKTALLAPWFSIRALLTGVLFLTTCSSTVLLLTLDHLNSNVKLNPLLIVVALLICMILCSNIAFHASAYLIKRCTITNHGKNKNYFSEIQTFFNEHNQALHQIAMLKKQLSDSNDEKVVLKKHLQQGKKALQAAHDISSPLDAIQTTLSVLPLEEKSHQILWSAFKNITHILNRLHRAPSVLPIHTEIKTYPLAGLLEKTFQMKQVEFSHSPIDLQLQIHPKALFSFTSMDPASLQSTLSNIINNSKESILSQKKEGFILLELQEEQNRLRISISDNGQNLPQKILQAMNEGTCVSSKHNRQPLGINSAREKLQLFGGTLNFLKLKPLGTQAIIQLPTYPQAAWFSACIPLLNAREIILCDSHLSTHKILKSKLLEQKIPLRIITNPKKFQHWLNQSDAFFLLNDEIQNFSSILNYCLENSSFASRSLLMTHRWDEDEVLEACKNARLKIIPKSFLAKLPIHQGSQEPLDFILIDDNAIVRLSWENLADQFGLKCKTFASPIDFEFHQRELDPQAILFVDLHLTEHNGIQWLATLKEQFPHHYLITGEEKGNINHQPLPEERVLFDKNFPFQFFNITPGFKL